MSIIVYHIDRDAPTFDRVLWVEASFGSGEPKQIAAAKALWEAGAYKKVAKVKDSLEHAYFFTQNLLGPWSINPDRAVTVVGDGYTVHNGQRYGYKSTEVGDIFRDGETGKLHLVVGCGFKEIE